MATLKERLKEYEGTIAYQKKLGYFRNDKFYTYKDSEGFSTIGYGHLLQRGENYPDGISTDKADELLDNDILIAVHNVETLNIYLPPDWKDFLVIMVFQLGLAGTLKFKKMLQALREKNYKEAIKQARDSFWYRQTPNRVDMMIAALTNK